MSKRVGVTDTCAPGLKSQHVTAIEALAKATQAKTEGLHVGSPTLEFYPQLPPTGLLSRKLNIVAESPAASALLITQALLPFFLFAAGDAPLEVDIHGGTNVTWSLSWEYFDQVLLPTLQDSFGLVIERKLVRRGWSLGPQSRGCLHLKLQPLPRGTTFKAKDPERNYVEQDFSISHIDASIVVAASMHKELQKALARDLEILFPRVTLNFVLVEDSGHDSRSYVLLVARSETLRWGRDILSSMPKAGKARTTFAADVSRRVSKDLFDEVGKRGVVDEFLQDQLVVYQALAEGQSSFPRSDRPSDELAQQGSLEQAMGDLELGDRLRKDRTDEPFGDGSLHTRTARWVVAEMLPTVTFYNRGSIVAGAAMKVE